MNSVLQAYSKRLVKFVSTPYTNEQWDKFSDTLWDELRNPKITTKVSDIEYNSFMDILVELDQNHRATARHQATTGGEFRMASSISPSKMLMRNMMERGWAAPVGETLQE